MKLSPKDFHKQLPLPANEKWKEGVWDIGAFAHGSMSLIYFAPQGKDYQTPHDQDELYIVLEGEGILTIEGTEYPFEAGDALFVPAGKTHRFMGELEGLKMWAIFYGPQGGEETAEVGK